MRFRVYTAAWAAALLLILSTAAIAQDVDELARQTQNPVASLISFPLQSNFDFGLGDREATATTLNVQPVIPIPLSRSTNLVLRVVMPLTSQPGVDGVRINGLSDVAATLFFSPARVGKIIWGAGPVMLLPAATSNRIGTEKFGVGPSVVVLVQPGKWSVGMLYNQIWSVSGANDRVDVNQALIQPFLSYNLGNGLATGVSVESSPNWKAPAAKWTTPVLFSVSKVTVLGKRPASFAVAAGPVLSGLETSPSWRFRLGVTLMFPR